MAPRHAAVRWVKAWVPQEVVSPGGKCSLLKWIREDKLKALREKLKEQDVKEVPKQEPTTEMLFLCSYDGCHKAFLEAPQIRKHLQVHGERQYACHFEGCDKKFLDSSKLKRHFLIHTGERNFVCPHEGCHKAFSLDFNLRAHMKTHSLDNYHVCPYPDCGKRYTQENKLNSHIRSHHQKHGNLETPKLSTPKEKPRSNTATPKTPATGPKTVSPNRPFACHHEGCGKAYIHEYKLKLHLRKEHANPDSEDNGKSMSPPSALRAPQEVGYANNVSKTNKRERQEVVTHNARAQKIVRREEEEVPSMQFDASGSGHQWVSEEDSEETEDDDDSGDDEETEDED
ncbi:zinc finger transcription factor YY1-like [Carex rostrata]